MKQKLPQLNANEAVVFVQPVNYKARIGVAMKLLLIAIAGILLATKTHAQVTATWLLNSDKTVAVTGPQAATVTALDMVPGSNFATGTHNTDGYKCVRQQPAAEYWPNVPTDGDHLDFPISPLPGNDLVISGISFSAKKSNSSGENVFAAFYQQDGAGPWTAFGPTPATTSGTTPINFGALSTTLSYGHTYVIRIYIYAASANTTKNNRAVYVENVVINGTTAPAGPIPDIATVSASATGRTTGTANGNITPVVSPVTASGICWNTAGTPTIADNFVATDPLVASGAFTGTITGLLAGTVYHVRAYATNAVGTNYGQEITFTTDAAVAPILTTTAASNISAIAAKSGGNITDDGGAAVTVRGVCWNTTGNPTIADAKSTDGTGAGIFSSTLNPLLPSTKYFVRAYATNTAGTGYGNEESFTTLEPTPTILVTPSTLNFGTVLQNTASAEQSYSLSAFFLSPAAGVLTLNAPAGYRISTTSGSGFSTSLSIPYSNSALAAITIYVKFYPTSIANYNGSVVNAGGGAPSQNVALTGQIEPTGGQSSQGFSNKGKDFWVGYGATEKMYDNNAQDLRFTFNNPNSVAATVTISIPNLTGFTPLVYTVPANSVVTTNGDEIPEGAADPLLDARLKDEGKSVAGIHIVSDQPIVVYAHDVTSSVYAASVLFPTPTLGREYTSLNFTQKSNNSVARSFCFAIATEDNTELQVTLPQGISTETHAAGTTFTQTLNKGEVLNLFGISQGGNFGDDLTGTVVKSISSSTNTCKPFAFYSGSSKISIDCGGNPGSADNLFQQVFPKVAWGYKYIAVPTLPEPYNYYRILVDDPATVVTVNGASPGGLINNTYYEYFNDDASIDVITGDKPIMVAQYMTTGGKCNNPSNGGTGDPEMIYLSSVQQTIDSVALVSSPLGNTGGRQHYLNIVTKTDATADFQLDGQPVVFTTIPTDVYSYAQVTVAEGEHRLTSKAGFNATAYGIANSESYGYNAGTNLIDLFSGFSVQNQFGAGTASSACRGSEFYMRVTLAFRATSILWDFATNADLAPNASITQTNPEPEDSVVVNGVKLYIYKLPAPYIYKKIGSFPVKISATNPTPDGCNGVKEFTFPVNVVQGPVPDFTFTNPTGCLEPIQFTDASSGNGGTLDSWQWNFGDNIGTSTLQSPAYTYTNGGSFSVKLRTVTLEGCYGDTTKTIAFSGVPVAAFTTKANGCEDVAQTFTDNSTIGSGNITQWVWNFGDNSDPVTAITGAAQTHTYATPGTYTATLSVKTSTGCTSALLSKEIVIHSTPSVNAGPDLEGNIGTPVQVTALADVATYLWTPATGLSDASSLTPMASPAVTTTYTLTATTEFDCKASDDMKFTVLGKCLQPSLVFTPNNDGFYDKWIVFNGDCVQQIEVHVYNRWGSEVYQSKRYLNDWDGTYKNKPLPDGTYYYVIKALLIGDDVQTVKGNVTIMR